MEQQPPTPGNLNVPEHVIELLEYGKENQPLPIIDYDAVISYIKQRDEFGKSKYGTSLHTDNGRCPYEDLKQELGDAIQYLMQILLEQKKDKAKLNEISHLFAVFTGLYSTVLEDSRK